MTLVASAHAGLPPAEAERRIAAVYWTAWVWPRDSAALDRLDAALAGRTINVTPRPQAGASRQAPKRAASAARSPWDAPSSASLSAAAPPDSLEPVTFMFINGISTSWSKADRTVDRLTQILSNTPRFQPHFDAGRARVDLAYNRTTAETPGTETVAERFVRCAYTQVAFRVWPSAEHYSRFLEGCVGILAPSAGDLIEAMRQKVALELGAGIVEEEARRIAGKVNVQKQLGSHVIVIAHSQGNLMTVQAERLRLDEYHQQDTWRDSTGFGALALASPIGTGWPIGSTRLRQIGVRGDLVQELFNSWETTPTRKSADAEQLLSWATHFGSPSGGSAGVRMAYALEFLKAKMALHDVQDSYLGQSEVKDKLKTYLTEIYDDMVVSTLEVNGWQSGYGMPAPDRRYVGERVAMRGRAFNKVWRTLDHRRFAIRSTDTSVVTVDANGVAMAVGPGTATIVARSWADSVMFVWHVEPVPAVSIAGTWTGDYVGNIAGGSGPVSITVGGVGSNPTGTMTIDASSGAIGTYGIANGFSSTMAGVSFYASINVTHSVVKSYFVTLSLDGSDPDAAGGSIGDGIGSATLVLRRVVQ